MRVLLVEDEAQIAGFVARGLREQGYAVDVAGDGDEALGWPSVAGADNYRIKPFAYLNLIGANGSMLEIPLR